jgi:hypothetical protein
MANAGFGIALLAFFGLPMLLPWLAPVFFFLAYRVRVRSERDSAALTIFGIMLAFLLVIQVLNMLFGKYREGAFGVSVPVLTGIGVASIVWPFWSRLGWGWRIGYVIFGVLAVGLSGFSVFNPLNRMF